MKTKLQDFLNALAALFFLGGILGGLGILGHQTYVWLRWGVWKEMSVMTALKWLNLKWAAFPQDWVGLHSILEKTPLSLGLVIVGIACGWLMLLMSDDLD